MVSGGNMALKQKPKHEDLILYHIVSHPVLFSEFYRNVDLEEHDQPIELTQYQKEQLCDFAPEVSMSQARATGKTFTLSSLMHWLLINNAFPGDYIIYSVPNKVHLKPVWDIMVRELRTNSFLKHFISRTTGINASEFIIRLLNSTTLMCRITGNDGTGRNVVGLHTPFFLIDEAALYEWKSWIEMQPTINKHTPGYRLIVAGVHSGVRDENVLYFVDQISDSFTKHRHSALENPRYSEKQHQDDIKRYGGVDSDDYIRNVLGLPGRPSYAIFDRSLMSISNYPTFKIVLDGLRLKEDISEYLNHLRMLPPLPDEARDCIIGVDLGYSPDPTAIWVMYKNRSGVFKFHAKIRMNKVSYPLQMKLLDYLDSKYKPLVIGIDEGNTGKSEIQRLKLDPALAHKNYAERVVPVAFKSNIIMGKDAEGEDIKQELKPFIVTVAQEFTNSGRLVYTSTDYDFISELERMTHTKTANGNDVYRTLGIAGGQMGEDHFTSAMLCALMAYYKTVEMEEINPSKKKLYVARFF